MKSKFQVGDEVQVSIRGGLGNNKINRGIIREIGTQPYGKRRDLIIYYVALQNVGASQVAALSNNLKLIRAANSQQKGV
jgi:hypothetical protein